AVSGRSGELRQVGEHSQAVAGRESGERDVGERHGAGVLVVGEPPGSHAHRRPRSSPDLSPALVTLLGANLHMSHPGISGFRGTSLMNGRNEWAVPCRAAGGAPWPMKRGR